MTRPTREKGLLEALTSAVSARVLKRVQDDPALAEKWRWSVTGDGAEIQADDVTVRIAGAVATDASVTCSCLMAPKCVHRLAVVTALLDAAPADAIHEAPEATAIHIEVTPLPDDARALVTDASVALEALLKLGAHRADALLRAGLVRCAWEARALGYPRLGRALTRVVQSLRLHEASHPTFSLPVLAADLADALWVARQLARGTTPELVGEARRRYEPVGALRVWGLVAEPVLAAGSAGVVTHLADAKGRIWEAPDVRPRAAGQAIGTYDVAPPISALSHRRLVREGLFIQGATAAGARLGAGEGVHAVRAGGAVGTAAPFDGLWVRGEAQGLRFLHGVVAGLHKDALLVETRSGLVSVVPGSEHSSLPWRDNLRLLARAPGLELQLIGRDVPDRPRTVVGLGLAGAALTLPEDWSGRVCLGLDRLTSAHLPGLSAAPRVVVLADGAAPPDPFASTRRRTLRLVLGGAASIPGEAMGQVELEVARLTAAAAPTAAALHGALADRALAARAPRSDAHALAVAWLACTRYLQHVDHERVRRAWAG